MNALYAALCAVGGVAFILIIGYLAIGFYASSEAFFVKKRSFDDIHAQDVKYSVPDSVSLLPYERVSIKGSQGYEMAASLIRCAQPSHKYALILHGYNSCRVTCNKYAKILNDLGYNALCPDMRRCGETGGRGITFGYYESRDAELWLDYIRESDPEAEIGIFGISLGAATAIMVAAKRKELKFLVSYCSYASMKEIIVDRMEKKIDRGLAKALYPCVMLWLFLRTGARVYEVKLYEEIKKVACPILIMHSDGDRFTNIRHAYRLLEARPDAEYKQFVNAPHARAYGVYPREYTEAVASFIKKTERKDSESDR